MFSINPYHFIFLTALPIHNAFALQPTILADSNRDGRVDTTGSSDIEAKNTNTNGGGALFLPAIGDTLRRCPSRDALGVPLSSAELAACNDGSSESLYAEELLAPLHTLPVKAGNESYGNIGVFPEEHDHRVRIFYKVQNGEWVVVNREYRFNSSQISAGLQLGIDSRELVQDEGVWDGAVRVRFTVYDNNATSSDEVAMQLAPVLTHNHLQSPEHILTVRANSSAPEQRQFVEQLEGIRQNISFPSDLIYFDQNEDIWAQDFFEPGYASMPGPDGTISVRILIRSPQPTRDSGRQVFELLRAKGIGAYQTQTGFGWREINSGGNIETIPPYASPSGETYPAGRIIVGKHFDLQPDAGLIRFIKSQKTQGDPLILEAGWLFVGHVDEFVSFLPADNEWGWTMAVADTLLGLDVLKNVSAAGHGSTKAYSIPYNLTEIGYPPELTVDGLLADKSLYEEQAYAQKYIDGNIAILLNETGLPESELVRVPVLFRAIPVDFPQVRDQLKWANGLPPRITPPQEPGQLKMSPIYPNAVNSLVLEKDVVTPMGWGPIVNGVSVLDEAVKTAFGREGVGMQVRFIDDFLSHHINLGEVHCGTNTFRDTKGKWWDFDEE